MCVSLYSFVLVSFGEVSYSGFPSSICLLICIKLNGTYNCVERLQTLAATVIEYENLGLAVAYAL